MKLEIALVPFRSHHISLRNILPSKDWKAIREEQLEISEYRCSVCESEEGKLFCHEDWNYDDNTLKQELKGFKIVCQLCNDVIHIGQALQRATETDYKEILAAHFMKVNNCNRKKFDQHFKDSWKLFRKRLRNKYSIDFGEYKPSDEIILRHDFNENIKRFKRGADIRWSCFEVLDRPEYIQNFKDEIIKTLIDTAKKGCLYELKHKKEFIKKSPEIAIIFFTQWEQLILQQI